MNQNEKRKREESMQFLWSNQVGVDEKSRRWKLGEETKDYKKKMSLIRE